MKWNNKGVFQGKSCECAHPWKYKVGGCPLAESWGDAPNEIEVGHYCLQVDLSDENAICEHLIFPVPTYVAAAFVWKDEFIDYDQVPSRAPKFIYRNRESRSDMPRGVPGVTAVRFEKVSRMIGFHYQEVDNGNV